MHLEPLFKLLGTVRCLTAKEDLIPYAFDGTAMLSQMPMAVIFPETTEEVSAILKWASCENISIVTRGSGTGLSGGSVPSPGSVVVCTARMNRILETDSRNLTIRAQSGVITQEIAKEAERVGLFYPPDPGSIKISTIGGNVAENSGGLRGLKYGVTRDYVMGLKVVLADGSILDLGNKCVKDVAGYSLKDLFIGSEGTLGFITEVLLKLLPMPKSRRTLLAVFERMADAAEAVSAIIAQGMVPCTLEFLDRVTIQCIEDYTKIGLPTDAEAILLMETDGHPDATMEEAQAMERIAKEHNAREVKIAQSMEESARLASARRSAFSALARVRPTTILEDVTVPRSELARMVRFIQEIGKKYQLRIGTFGHMGDGNLHPTFLTDERDHTEIARVEQAMDEIFSFAVTLGGTITGEHGVGLAKKAFFMKTRSETELRVMAALKKSLDPLDILNPGKIFDR